MYIYFHEGVPYLPASEDISGRTILTFSSPTSSLWEVGRNFKDRSTSPTRSCPESPRETFQLKIQTHTIQKICWRLMYVSKYQHSKEKKTIKSGHGSVVLLISTKVMISVWLYICVFLRTWCHCSYLLGYLQIILELQRIEDVELPERNPHLS